MVTASALVAFDPNSGDNPIALAAAAAVPIKLRRLEDEQFEVCGVPSGLRAYTPARSADERVFIRTTFGNKIEAKRNGGSLR